MMEWWHARSERERWILIGGGVIVLLFLVYAYLWLPLSDRVTTLQTSVQRQQQLLYWLRRAQRDIMAYHVQGYRVAPSDTENLLVVAQRSLALRQLEKYVTQISQPNAQQLTLQFQQIPFDNFIGWLQQLSLQHGITASQITITPLTTVGVVNVAVTLTRAA